MPSELIPYFATGEQVTHPALPGQVLVVKRTKQTRAIVVPADNLTGAGYDPFLRDLSHALDSNGNRLPLVTFPAPAPTAAVNRLRVGTIFRMTRAYRHWTTEDLMVVVAVNQKTVSAVKVGGEDNPGVRVPFTGVTIVDASTLTLAV